MATAQKDKPKLDKGTEFDFYSKHSHLRLIRIPKAVVSDGWGGQMTRERFPGVERCIYEFERGHLQVVVGGKNWHEFPDGPDGETQNTLDWLRAHDEYNARFHEAGAEPDRPLPTDEDFHKMLRRALVGLDVDKVTEMLRDERASHQREPLIKAADDTRKQILELRQEYAEQDGAA